MSQDILLYISAAADLETEREVLGRAVAEIPVDLNWRIVQSPRKNEPLDHTAVVQADVHLLVLGGDIRAPIGLEWLAAIRAGRRPELFIKQGIGRTAAAVDFFNFVGRQATWQPFGDPAELRHLASQHLADHLQSRSAALGLMPQELDRLDQWLADLASLSPRAGEETRGGAGESSLLLSRERFRPSGGVLLEEDIEES